MYKDKLALGMTKILSDNYNTKLIISTIDVNDNDK